MVCKIDGNTLVVGAWGMITDPATFATAVKGRVKLVDLETKAITNVGTGPTANIDGIVKYGDDYFITDWAAGALIQVSAGGSASGPEGRVQEQRRPSVRRHSQSDSRSRNGGFGRSGQSVLLCPQMTLHQHLAG